MENLQEVFVGALVEAKSSLRNARYLAHVAHPILKDNKLLIRALEHCHKAAVKIISLILKYEYLHKRISLTKNHARNLEIFFIKCRKRYGVTKKEEKALEDLFKMNREHQESSMEFPQKEKIVMILEKGKVDELDIEQLKLYVQTLENFIKNTQNKIYNERAR